MTEELFLSIFLNFFFFLLNNNFLSTLAILEPRMGITGHFSFFFKKVGLSIGKGQKVRKK